MHYSRRRKTIINNTITGKVLKYILIALGMEAFSGGSGILCGFLAIRAWGDGSMLDLGLAIMGFMLGGIVGIVAGIIALKMLFHQKGSIIVALIAAVVWGGIATLLALVLNLGNNFLSNVISVLFIVLPAVATGGFYLGKRQKTSSN